MADIILSIRPRWAALILGGLKTIEVRRVLPKRLNEGDTIYLCHDSKLVGHVEVAKIDRDVYWPTIRDSILLETCLTRQELRDYGAGKAYLGLIHLKNPHVYETPKEYHGSTVQNFIYY